MHPPSTSYPTFLPDRALGLAQGVVAPIRILMVEDDPLVRAYLRDVLDIAPDLDRFALAGEAVTGEDALRQARELRPDLVLLDLGLPDLDGVEVALRLRTAQPEARILALTCAPVDDPRVGALVRLGVEGYLHKDAGPEAIADALRAVATRQDALSHNICREVDLRAHREGCCAIPALRQNALFQGVAEDELVKLSPLVRVQTYHSGDYLWSPDEAIGAVFIVAVGYMRLYRLLEDGQEVTTAMLGPCAVCGLAGVDETFVSTTFAQVTASGTVIYSIPRQLCMDFLMTHPQVALRALGIVCRRVQDAYDRIEDLSLPCARARLARVLVRLCVSNAEQPIRATHEELAALARASREEVTRRILPELRDRGLITYQRRSGIQILDLAGLIALSMPSM